MSGGGCNKNIFYNIIDHKSESENIIYENNEIEIDYYNLFLWLHRSKGDVQGVGSGINPPELINYWSGTGAVSYFSTYNTLVVTENTGAGNTELVITPTTSSDYKISVFRNGELFYQSNTLNNTQTINLGVLDVAQYTFYIQAQVATLED